MAQYPQDDSAYNLRPTLPPIRDLFRNELSRRPDTPHESPSLTLARLRVSDEDEYTNPSSRSSRRSSRHPPQPLHDSSDSSEYFDPSLHRHHGESHLNPAPMRTEHPSVAPQTTTPSYSQVSRASSYSSSYLHSSVDNHMSRSASHHHTHSQPPRFLSSHAVAQDHQTSSALPETPYMYSGLPAPPMARRRSEVTLTHPSLQLSWNISTQVALATAGEDDEQTPVARYSKAPSRMEPMNISHVDTQQLQLDEAMGNVASRYECPYCGKGFNRPSSLKIHLNSHTGEKPFVCPVESCKRSFSVLSNMRRHARVHNIPFGQESGSSEMPFPPSSTVPASYSSSHESHRRRGSSASSSSANVSRRSRSVSSNDDLDDEDHGDSKRTRRNIT
ncbi:hypothetical protein BJ912DRAFT_577002 [Pholiota molesta]|nr:hypothetical protein BJ912DRAFT_577002 [Pholiota molesta]